MAKKPAVGEPAPDFELDGTDGRFKLSEHRGERVILCFYPGDKRMLVGGSAAETNQGGNNATGV
jgi:hypothetical protein